LLRNHIADPDRLVEFRKPTYVHPNPNIKVNSFRVGPSQNPLMREQLAYEVAIGSRDARTGKQTKTETDTEIEHSQGESVAVE